MGNVENRGQFIWVRQFLVNILPFCTEVWDFYKYNVEVSGDSQI